MRSSTSSVRRSGLRGVGWCRRRGSVTISAVRGPGRRVETQHGTPWTDAGDAIAESDLARAADILEPTGARTFVAAVRLRAAQKAAVEGRAREASEQLAPAMAFYREVGASAFIREAEALLAEAS